MNMPEQQTRTALGATRAVNHRHSCLASASLAALLLHLWTAMPAVASGYGLTGTLAAAPTSALAFDGVNDYVETGTSVIPTSGDFTVECWVACPAAPNTYREVLSQGSPGNAFYIGTDMPNNIRLGDGWTTGVPFPIGGWHHLAVVKTSGNTLLYLDGTNRLTKGSAIPNPASSTGLRLGRQYGSGGEYWSGSLGDVRIWGKALSAAEVFDSRTNRLTGAEAGLVAAWPFLEVAGTNCTSIGATNIIAKLVNGPFWMTPSSDFALTFDGVNDYVETSTGVIPSGGDFTVAFWAQAPAAPSTHREILSQGSTGNALYIGTDAANNLRLGDGWGAVSPAIPFPVGGWHHFTIVKSTNETIFYLDGTNRLSRGWGIPNPTASTGLRFGRQYGSGGEYWPGSLDDVSIWNKALSDAEVQGLLKKTVTGAESKLVAYWSFNDLTFAAQGGTNVVGLLVNGPTWTPLVWSPPGAITGEATSISPTGASLGGTVNSGNLPTTVWFELGATTNYGQLTPSTVVSPTNGSLAVSVSPSNLTAGLTYHFRIVANNGLGQTNGSDRTFQTPTLTLLPGLPGVSYSSVAWGDYDNDGRLDILLTGVAGSDIISRVYRNNENGTFTDINAGLPGVCSGSVAWGDYDNDGWLDILISGSTGSNNISQVYRNNKNGTFTDINAGLPGVIWGGVAWGDYDNDGRLDILIVGDTGSGNISRVYRNSGNGTFSWNTNAVLSGVKEGSVAWGDYDNDGRLDILLTGAAWEGDWVKVSRVYRNNGNGTFSDINAGLQGVQDGSVAWGDYDNDGRLDILLTGFTGYTGAGDISRVYRNNGNGTFTDINAGVPGVSYGGVAWGDYDNDGWLDILISGTTDFKRISRVYRNNKNGTFTDLNVGLPGVITSSVAWGDYNKDGRLDILLTGSITNSSNGDFAGIYRNYCPLTNTPPSAPTGLTSTVSDTRVTLSWTAASDATTLPAGLTYNLRVGTTPGGSDILSPQSNPTNGLRRLPRLGNAQHKTNTILELSRLSGIVCYWSVQAVDTAWAGSPFAAEGTFTTPDISQACALVSEPGDVTAFSGTPAALTAKVAGYLRDCRWYRSSGAAVPGGTNAILSWTNVAFADAGKYLLVVSNGFGMVTSRVASVTVWANPVSQSALAGARASLAVSLPGAGSYSYQWQLNGTNLSGQSLRWAVGNGSPGFSGDGGPAINASLESVGDLAVDTAGNLFIADSLNNRIRKVGINGWISTVAGTGTNGYNGSGLPALQTSLARPEGVAVDGAGNLFIADGGNWIVRKLDAGGLLNTFAGNHTWGYSGDAGPATNAEMRNPSSVACDNMGNVLIGDPNTHRVRKVTLDGRMWTVAGNGTSISSGDLSRATNLALNYPNSIAVNQAGDFYVGDRFASSNKDDLLYRVNLYGASSLIAGGGTDDREGIAATNAATDIAGLAVDKQDNVYLSDLRYDRIRKIGTDGIIRTVVCRIPTDGGAAFPSSLSGPRNLAMDRAGSLYINDSGNGRICQLPNVRGPELVLANVTRADAGGYRLIVNNPASGLCLTSAVASLVITAPPYVTSQPVELTSCSGSSVQFNVMALGDPPLAFRWFKVGGSPLVMGTETNLVLSNLIESQAGDYFAVISNSFGSVTSRLARLTMVAPPRIIVQPQDMVLGAKGSLSAGVSGAGPFAYQWQHEGTNLPQNIISTLTNLVGMMPAGMATDNAGNLFVVDAQHHRILKMTTSGLVMIVAGKGTNAYSGDGGQATNATLSTPYSVTVDGAGNLFISDAGNARIRKVSTNGIITTVAGNGTNSYSGDGGPATNASLNTPTSVVFDRSGGMLIADAMNHRIRKVATNGIISTVAGTGTNSFSGDGGPATQASLNTPIQMVMDAAGVLFVSDYLNHCVRKVATNGIIATVAGNPTRYPGGDFAGDLGPATNAAFNGPAGLVFDAAGNLYIADTRNNRVRCVDRDGLVFTVAGTGRSGSAGDGGPATAALLNNPFGLVFDAVGSLYISSPSGNAVRKIVSLSGPTLNLGVASTDTLGRYQLIVTSLLSGGTATSTVAVISLARVRIRIDASFGFLTNRFGFNMTSPTNQSVVVEATTNLGAPLWTPLKTNSVGPNGVYFSDPNWQQFPTRIYRLRTLAN